MTRLRRSLLRTAATAGLVVVAAIAGLAVSPDTDRTVNAVGEPLGAGGEFHEVTPTRIFDSRTSGGPRPMAAEGVSAPFDVQLVGRGGLPAFVDGDGDGFDDNVLAVVVNITVIAPDQIGFLRAYGTGTNEGGTSVVNFFPNTFVPNTAIIRPGRDGKMTIRLVSPIRPGRSDVAVDVTGWFSSSTHDERGARLIPIEPARVYDSDVAKFGGTTLKGRTQIRIPIRGADRMDGARTDIVPDDADVVGAIVNITGVNVYPGSRPTYLAAVPTPVPAGGQPSTSNVNLLPGQFRANLTIMPVGPDGAIHLFNLQGEVRLVIDVMGYLLKGEPTDTRQGRVVPLEAPFRAFDTREAAFFSQPLGPANAEDWSFESFVNDVKIGGVPVGAQLGLIGNLTATNLERQYSWAPVASFMTAFPSPASGSAVPNISNLNIAEGDTVPNLAVLRYGTTSEGPNRLRFYNRAGYVDYLLDVYAVVLQD